LRRKDFRIIPATIDDDSGASSGKSTRCGAAMPRSLTVWRAVG